METVKKAESKTEKKAYSKPTIRSQKVLERAALACAGSAYPNSYYNLKNSYYSCGFISS
jgi:hypothetical protein